MHGGKVWNWEALTWTMKKNCSGTQTLVGSIYRSRRNKFLRLSIIFKVLTKNDEKLECYNKVLTPTDVFFFLSNWTPYLATLKKLHRPKRELFHKWEKKSIMWAIVSVFMSSHHQSRDSHEHSLSITALYLDIALSTLSLSFSPKNAMKERTLYAIFRNYSNIF